MDLYTAVGYENSKHLTLRYSTSFGISSKLFGTSIKNHIYAIYALVRIADEVVDTYRSRDSVDILNMLETEVYQALESKYSTNLIIHAFVNTAQKYNISEELIRPFFESMRMDISPNSYNDNLYGKYIYGSAEVVGLMCLRVFVNNNNSLYEELYDGARALGSAYQKVNFLRDFAADFKQLGRVYFPNVSYDTFNEVIKNEIIKDIKKDFSIALPYLLKLPASCKKATYMSYVYYMKLLKKLEGTPVEVIKQKRISVPNYQKFGLLLKTILLGGRDH